MWCKFSYLFESQFRYIEHTGNLVVGGSWEHLPSLVSWYWTNCMIKCANDSFVGGSSARYCNEIRTAIIALQTSTPLQVHIPCRNDMQPKFTSNFHIQLHFGSIFTVILHWSNTVKLHSLQVSSILQLFRNLLRTVYSSCIEKSRWLISTAAYWA